MQNRGNGDFAPFLDHCFGMNVHTVQNEISLIYFCMLIKRNKTRLILTASGFSSNYFSFHPVYILKKRFIFSTLDTSKNGGLRQAQIRNYFLLALFLYLLSYYQGMILVFLVPDAILTFLLVLPPILCSCWGC